MTRMSETKLVLTHLAAHLQSVFAAHICMLVWVDQPHRKAAASQIRNRGTHLAEQLERFRKHDGNDGSNENWCVEILLRTAMSLRHTYHAVIEAQPFDVGNFPKHFCVW